MNQFSTNRRDDAALVLFSGGQDSTTCLAWALSRYDRVETIGFDYRQRHRVELDARIDVLAAIRERFADWTGRLGEDHLIDAGVLADLGQTAMTADIAIETAANGLPNTFVPGRNLLFLTLAAALATRRGIDTLIGGMCETDFSGYPDCRRETIDSQALTLTLGLGQPVRIETPLMWINKAQTWALADQLGGGELVDVIIDLSHTCYLGHRDPRHPWGRGCGSCPACQLRATGWESWQETRR